METLDEAAGEVTTDTKQPWLYFFPGDDFSSSFSRLIRDKEALDFKTLYFTYGMPFVPPSVYLMSSPLRYSRMCNLYSNWELGWIHFPLLTHLDFDRLLLVPSLFLMPGRGYDVVLKLVGKMLLTYFLPFTGVS